MIEALISSKTRIKLLLKFFLNSDTTSYLRGLSTEFGESSNSIRLELNRFEKAGMINSFAKGNKKLFKANTKHPLFSEIHNIILKYVGLDKIIENVINKLGDLKRAYVVGDYASGTDSSIIDMLFFGDIDKNYLNQLSEKVEKKIDRKIRILSFSSNEEDALKTYLENQTSLLLWEKEN